jgi:hypothetical protein
MVKIMKLPLFMMGFVNVYIHFRIWTRIRNPEIRQKFRILADPDSQHWLHVNVITKKTTGILYSI